MWIFAFCFLLAVIAVESSFIHEITMTTAEVYSKDRIKLSISGHQMAQAILEGQGVSIAIASTPKPYADHFDPKTQTLVLSSFIYNRRCVAALAFAAYQSAWALRDLERRPSRSAWNILYAAAGALLLIIPVKTAIWQRFDSWDLFIFCPLFLLFLVVFLVVTVQEFALRREARGFLRWNSGSRYFNAEQMENAEKAIWAASLRRMTYLFLFS